MAQPFRGEHRVVQEHADDGEDAVGDVEDVHCTDAAAVVVVAVVGFPEAAAYEAGDDVDWAFVAGHGDCATARDAPDEEAAADDVMHDGVADEDDDQVHEGDVLGNIVVAVVDDVG